jgi:hypothetical protein
MARVDCRRTIKKIDLEDNPSTPDSAGIHILLRKFEDTWRITAVSAP